MYHLLTESGSLRSMMSRDSRPPFGLDSLSALSKPSASSPKLFNSLLLGSSMAQSKPEGSSLRDLLNSGPGRLSQGPGESGVPFPSVFTSAGVRLKILLFFVCPWSVQSLRMSTKSPSAKSYSELILCCGSQCLQRNTIWKKKKGGGGSKYVGHLMSHLLKNNNWNGKIRNNWIDYVYLV